MSGTGGTNVEQDHLHLEGWLKYWVTGLFRDGFKRRWLLREGEKLFMFESERTLEHVDVIDLNRVVAVRPVENGFGTNEVEQLGFKLVTDDDKKYYFLAKSEDDLKKWVRGIVTWTNHLNRLYKRTDRPLLTFFFASKPKAAGSQQDVAQPDSASASSKEAVASNTTGSTSSAAASSTTTTSSSVNLRTESTNNDVSSSNSSSSRLRLSKERQHQEQQVAAPSDQHQQDPSSSRSSSDVLQSGSLTAGGQSSPSASVSRSPAKKASNESADSHPFAEASLPAYLRLTGQDEVEELRLVMQSALRAKISEGKVRRLYSAVASFVERRRPEQDAVARLQSVVRERERTIARLESRLAAEQQKKAVYGKFDSKQQPPASATATAQEGASQTTGMNETGGPDHGVGLIEQLRAAQERVHALETKIADMERRRQLVTKSQSANFAAERKKMMAIIQQHEETIKQLKNA